MKSRGGIQNQKGSATLEAVALLVIFAVMIAYTLGSFGVVHTAILNSIAARNYAFETFRQRANLTYFRDTSSDVLFSYRAAGFRAHGVISDESKKLGSADPDWDATERSLSRGLANEDVGRQNAGLHNEGLRDEPKTAREQRAVNPVWIKTVYGICLFSDCQGRSTPQ